MNKYEVIKERLELMQEEGVTRQQFDALQIALLAHVKELKAPPKEPPTLDELRRMVDNWNQLLERGVRITHYEMRRIVDCLSSCVDRLQAAEKRFNKELPTLMVDDAWMKSIGGTAITIPNSHIRYSFCGANLMLLFNVSFTSWWISNKGSQVESRLSNCPGGIQRWQVLDLLRAVKIYVGDTDWD